MTDETDRSETLYLVDGSSYIYRAHYGIRRSLTTSDGVPTNAVYGFTQMVQTLLAEEEPEYIGVAFDAFEADRPNFRKELYDDYKAHRDEMPEELQEQLPYLERVVQALRIPILRDPEVEADDLIASAARWGRSEGLDVCIVSGDKDLMQLLGDGVWMYDTMRDEKYGPDEVEDRFGVSPDEQKYVMAMAGDSSDNIPGVPGIGPKTGGKLIRQFGDLDGVYANLDEVGGKKRPKKLARNEEEARLSLELVTLREDCELEVDTEDLRFCRPDVETLVELFEELEFQSLREELVGWLDQHGWAVDRDQLELSLGPADHEATGKEMPEKDYRRVEDLEELEAVIEACRDSEQFAFDLETTSLDSLEAEIVGFAFAWEPHRAVYVPVGHVGEGADRQLDREAVLERVRPLLESEDQAKILQHWKYEWIVLKEAGVELRGVAYDTMLMSYALEPGRNTHALDALVRDHLDYDTISYGDVARRDGDEISFEEVSVDDAVPYAAEDADVTLLLARELVGQLRESGLEDFLEEVEVPLSRVLGIMERTGIGVDREVLGQLSTEFESELEELREEIAEHAGKEVNPNSPKQLREVLFDDLGLPVQKRTKTGPSTARPVLEELSDMHPLPDLILEYRSFSKLKGTYVDALPELIRDDGRIHTSFNQAVAATGRLSSSEPNLQNIPIRTDRGKRIRGAFVPREGWKLVTADYSQIELRILAHLSRDPLLLEAYRQGRDVHTLTASQIFGLERDEVGSDERELGKTINYGVLYGMGSRRLARDFDISESKASDYIDSYFDRYEVVDAFFEELVEDAYRDGYAETMFGRRRALPGLEGHGGEKAYAERAAVNTPIQGTAADIIKIAMVDLQERIDERGLPLKMLLQVHDELVFETPSDRLGDSVGAIREEMEGVVDLEVPLKVDIGAGENWLKAK